MLKTNEKQVVKFWLQCQPGSPRTKPMWRVSHEGGVLNWGRAGTTSNYTDLNISLNVGIYRKNKSSPYFYLYNACCPFINCFDWLP